MTFPFIYYMFQGISGCLQYEIMVTKIPHQKIGILTPPNFGQILNLKNLHIHLKHFKLLQPPAANRLLIYIQEKSSAIAQQIALLYFLDLYIYKKKFPKTDKLGDQLVTLQIVEIVSVHGIHASISFRSEWFVTSNSFAFSSKKIVEFVVTKSPKHFPMNVFVRTREAENLRHIYPL